ncbi:MAG: phosphate ABC transporter permease subunit PstC [Robiginitomaculum sp.]|nr:MAG: phosphate ABC transporter permease subunit PstC [Robiginitomaculum sp.]
MVGLVIIMMVAWFTGRAKAVSSAGVHPSSLHSLPGYSGAYLAIWAVLPAFILLALFGLFGDVIVNMQMRHALPDNIHALAPEQIELFLRNARALASGGTASETSPALVLAAERYTAFSRTGNIVIIVLTLAFTLGGFFFARARIGKNFRARNHVEAVIFGLLVVCAAIAILTTLGIVLSLLTESLRFFSEINALDFLFGLKWSPQTAMRADQVGQSGSFGAVPLFAGTFLITLIAMVVAAPVGLYSAIYLSEYAKPSSRRIIKPILEILAGVPTVVYGFFALLTVGPFIRQLAESVGLGAQTQSALSAGLVMGIMIIPFVSSLSDDVINAVPQSLRDGSYAMGATQAETVRNVVFPAALPGIMGALLLAISRAIGETMIVVMAAGQSANLTANPLEPVTTVTVQIVTLLTGDQEFDSAKTLSAFALGLVLFVITLGLNIISLSVVRKYRERYD